MNYKYAKIISVNEIEYAPKILKISNKSYINPKESIYNKAGYYRIVLENQPDDKNEYTTEFTLEDKKIVQKWIMSV